MLTASAMSAKKKPASSQSSGKKQASLFSFFKSGPKAGAEETSGSSEHTAPPAAQPKAGSTAAVGDKATARATPVLKAKAPAKKEQKRTADKARPAKPVDVGSHVDAEAQPAEDEEPVASSEGRRARKRISYRIDSSDSDEVG
jgi:hypothetical protein